jgi:hypothetical protein
MNHIKRTFEFEKDFGSAIETFEDFIFKKYELISILTTSDDEMARFTENRNLGIEFKIKVDAYMNLGRKRSTLTRNQESNY